MQGIDIEIPSPLIEQAARWDSLKRWERRELGQALRRLGLSYKEIGRIIPVSRGTLSGWCRDIELSEHLRARLMSLRPAGVVRQEVGLRRRNAALERQAAIRAKARVEASALLSDSFWTAGLVAYWSEGTKRSNLVQFANSDPLLIQLFIRWAHRFLGVTSQQLYAQLHLHDGQDEDERKEFWSAVTGIPLDGFGKAYIKKEGTGHRKNVLYNGTISIRVRRSSDMLQRIKGWIEECAEVLGR